MNFDTIGLVVVAAGFIAIVAMLMQVRKKGADMASPKRVMRHINDRRRFMGQPTLFDGDPALPESWTCNDVRRNEWRAKL